MASAPAASLAESMAAGARGPSPPRVAHGGSCGGGTAAATRPGVEASVQQPRKQTPQDDVISSGGALVADRAERVDSQRALPLGKDSAAAAAAIAAATVQHASGPAACAPVVPPLESHRQRRSATGSHPGYVQTPATIQGPAPTQSSVSPEAKVRASQESTGSGSRRNSGEGVTIGQSASPTKQLGGASGGSKKRLIKPGGLNLAGGKSSSASTGASGQMSLRVSVGGSSASGSFTAGGSCVEPQPSNRSPSKPPKSKSKR